MPEDKQDQKQDAKLFEGFTLPHENWSKLPHDFINKLPLIDTVAELKVILYALRHTWGFSEYGKPKKMTNDEIMNGRKRRDGSRMDNGTGLTENSVRAGADKAVDHGFLDMFIDDHDAGRVKKWYSLRMLEVAEEQVDDDPSADEVPPSIFEPAPAKFEGRPANIEGRTEKETPSKIPERKKKSINTPLSKEDKDALAEAKRKAKQSGDAQPWRFREIFLAPEGLVELADLCVQYFGTPIKKEAWALRETCVNMLENKVTPADLIATKADTDTWSHKPISANGAFLTKAKAVAMDRINASKNKAATPSNNFPTFEDGQAVIK